jgi:UTP-glucose-1-phosphate uridylyltransferase
MGPESGHHHCHRTRQCAIEDHFDVSYELKIYESRGRQTFEQVRAIQNGVYLYV